MSKINKLTLAILALLFSVGIARLKAEPEEGVSTWFHNSSTGTGVALPSSAGAVIYGLTLSTAGSQGPWAGATAVVTFYSTNTRTGTPDASPVLWEVPITSYSISNAGWRIEPPAPIRAGVGFAYRSSDANQAFTIFYHQRR